MAPFSMSCYTNAARLPPILLNGDCRDCGAALLPWQQALPHFPHITHALCHQQTGALRGSVGVVYIIIYKYIYSPFLLQSFRNDVIFCVNPTTQEAQYTRARVYMCVGVCARARAYICVWVWARARARRAGGPCTCRDMSAAWQDRQSQSLVARMQSRRSRLETERFQGSLIPSSALICALAVQKFPLGTYIEVVAAKVVRHSNPRRLEPTRRFHGVFCWGLRSGRALQPSSRSAPGALQSCTCTSACRGLRS